MPPNPHPLVVHFTIGLFTFSLVFDIVGWLTNNKSLRDAGRWNLYAGFLAACLTVATGLLAEGSVGYPEAARDIVADHKLLGIVILSIIGMLAFLRFFLKDNMSGVVLVIYFITGLVGIGFLIAGAYHGGELLYHYGVGVEAVP